MMPSACDTCCCVQGSVSCAATVCFDRMLLQMPMCRSSDEDVGMQVGKGQWNRVLDMVSRIRGLGMEVGLPSLPCDESLLAIIAELAFKSCMGTWSEESQNSVILYSAA